MEEQGLYDGQLVIEWPKLARDPKQKEEILSLSFVGSTLTVWPDTSEPVNPRVSSEATRFSIARYGSDGREVSTQTLSRGASAPLSLQGRMG